VRVPVVFINVVPVRLANPRVAFSCGASTKALASGIGGQFVLSGSVSARQQRECVRFNLQKPERSEGSKCCVNKRRCTNRFMHKVLVQYRAHGSPWHVQGATYIGSVRGAEAQQAAQQGGIRQPRARAARPAIVVP